MSTGGAIEEVGINGRTFTATGDNDGSRKLGGFENTQEPNGNGSTRLIKLRVPWQVGGLQLNCDDLNSDQEYLQEQANLKRNFPITISFVSGVVYEGVGQIVGELTFANQSTTNSFDISGPGELAQ